MNNYKDAILERVKEVLNTHGSTELKGRYGIGDPGVVNKSQLSKPMAFISYEEQSLDMDASHEMESTLPVVIDIVCDMTRDFGQGLDAKGHQRVISLACGRNDDFSIREDSVSGVFMHHQDLTKNGDPMQLFVDPATPIQVELDYQTRDKGLVTAEAIVHLTLKTNQLINL